MKRPCRPKLSSSDTSKIIVNTLETKAYSSMTARSVEIAEKCLEAVVIDVRLHPYEHKPGSALQVTYQLPDNIADGERRIFRDRMNLWSTPSASSVNSELLDTLATELYSKLVTVADESFHVPIPSEPTAEPFQWLLGRIFYIVIAKSPHTPKKSPMFYVAHWDCIPLLSGDL